MRGTGVFYIPHTIQYFMIWNMVTQIVFGVAESWGCLCVIKEGADLSQKRIMEIFIHFVYNLYRMTLYTHQSSNIRKTWLLMLGFFGVVLGLGYGLSWYYGDTAFLFFAGAIAVVQGGISYFFSDKIALSMSGAKLADKNQHLELIRLVENLAITAGIPMPRVYVIDDSVPNAFATGRNPQHAAIAVTTGLLSRLDRNELEGVIAHEMAHIGNRDILVMSVVMVLAGIITMIVDMGMRMAMFGGDRRDERGGNPVMLVVTIVMMILAPIVGTLIQFAISRKREFLADATGALLTRYPEGLASALEKISQTPGDMKHANQAMAHMYIASPFGKDRNFGKKISGLFMTHPPVFERIARLRQK